MRGDFDYDLSSELWGEDLIGSSKNCRNLYEEGVLWRYQIISVVGSGAHGKVQSNLL